jgi:plastocyanin/cytochrome c556
MQPTHRWGFSLLAAAACCLLTWHSVQARAGQPQEGGATALMKELSSDFAVLEKEIQARNTAGVASALDTFRAAYPRVRTLQPALHRDLADEFGRHVERFGELLDEIGELASQSRPLGAEQAFDELRATCVSCHMKFRPDNEVRGDFPARESTITGAISLSDSDGAVRTDRSWVLVFLESTEAAPPYAWQRGTKKLSQKLRQFQPRVLPVVVGTTVEFPNDDTIFHNVFSLSKTKPFDLGLYEPGHTASVALDRTGLVKVYCNVHPDMNASIVVLANPWFALTDRDGRFVICNVPAGEYTLRAWNDLGASASENLSLGSAAAGPLAVATLALKETLRVVRHNNKFGKAYPDKY